jgi:hypothetical protein
MLPEPNWDEISAIAKRAEKLNLAGQIDRETWMGLLDEAYAASQGNSDLTSFLAPYAKGEWVRDLLKSQPPTRRKSLA